MRLLPLSREWSPVRREGAADDAALLLPLLLLLLLLLLVGSVGRERERPHALAFSPHGLRNRRLVARVGRLKPPATNGRRHDLPLVRRLIREEGAEAARREQHPGVEAAAAVAPQGPRGVEPLRPLEGAPDRRREGLARVP